MKIYKENILVDEIEIIDCTTSNMTFSEIDTVKLVGNPFDILSSVLD